jgi:biotin operon repressor
MTNDLQTYFDLVFPHKNLKPLERVMFLCLYSASLYRSGEKFNVKLKEIVALSGASETSVREYVRCLREKGLIEIESVDRSGYTLSLISPLSIPGITKSSKGDTIAVDLEAIDFFTDRRFVSALLERQSGKCFYSLKQLQVSSTELDHLVPQVDGLDNSYRNIVCCTFEMNKRKGSMRAEDFLRELYRSGILSEVELKERLRTVASIREGQLKPKL